MSDRIGLPQLGIMGFASVASKSLLRPPNPFFSVRLKILGHLGIKIPADYYGDTLTWGELGGIKSKWGNNETIIYDGVKPGWTYSWDVGTKIFTVTDNLGNVTKKTVTIFSDLGITWDILASHQFSIHLTAKYENDAFLIGWFYAKGSDQDTDNPYKYTRVGYVESAYIWSFVDRYLNQIYHAVYKRLLNMDMSELLQSIPVNERIVDINTNFTDYTRSIINASIIDLDGTGNYPNNFSVEELNGTGVREVIEKQAESVVLGTMLMIRIFASINNMSKQVYEPWMLWELWKWLGSGRVIISRDRVFDLSPWWG